MSKHFLYILNQADSELWRQGHRDAMGRILRDVATEVRDRGADRFSLFDAEENLLLRVPLDGIPWADTPNP